MIKHKIITVSSSGLLIGAVRPNGTVVTHHIKLTVAQYDAGIKAYKNGAMMQNAFPMLDADDREFLISGMTPSAWDAMFGADSRHGADSDD